MFTVKDRLEKIEETPELRELGPYMVYVGKNEFPEFFRGLTIEEKSAADGWNAAGIVKGLDFLEKMRMSGNGILHRVYTDPECADDPEKRNVNVVRFVPENNDPKKPYIVLCAGGGYSCVCSMVEAYPTAAQLVAAGFQVFTLTYRVLTKPVHPLALDDLAAALRFIDGRAEEFGITAGKYAVGGFSAGAHLICGWGTGFEGWKAHGCGKPVAMFPIYAPVVKWGIEEHVDAEYPPCYIVCGKDDMTVPCVNSEALHEMLDRLGVMNCFEEGEHAPHGFGDGTGTDVDGWPMRAAGFLMKLI